MLYLALLRISLQSVANTITADGKYRLFWKAPEFLGYLLALFQLSVFALLQNWTREGRASYLIVPAEFNFVTKLNANLWRGATLSAFMATRCSKKKKRNFYWDNKRLVNNNMAAERIYHQVISNMLLNTGAGHVKHRTEIQHKHNYILMLRIKFIWHITQKKPRRTKALSINCINFREKPRIHFLREVKPYCPLTLAVKDIRSFETSATVHPTQ